MTFEEPITKFDSKSRYYGEGGIETLDVIKAKLTPEQYKGYLLGNALKYQCRMNFKGVSDNDKLRDAEKAANYTAWLRDAMSEAETTISQIPNNITQKVEKTTDVYKDVKLATSVLTENMQADKQLAWSWHCQITYPMLNEGVERIAANKAAAKIMKTLFHIDTTQHEGFKLTMESKCVRAEITMDFGTAIEALKNGKKVARQSWNKGVFLWETNGSILISISYDPDVRSWSAGSTDILAEDWLIIEKEDLIK